MNLHSLIDFPLPPLHPALQIYAEWVEVAAGWGLDTKTLVLLLAFLILWLRCRLGRRRLVRAHNRVLQELTERDPLTQVVNRRRLESQMAQMIENFQRYGHGFCVILFELDQLKQINSARGHRLGDRILIESCGRIQDRLRKMDTLGRWTGSRFAILCPSIDSAQGLLLAEKLCTSLAETPLRAGTTQTASFGVVEFMDKEMTAEALMSMAEDALFAARSEGGNRVRGWP